MKINVAIDDIPFGTSIQDIKVPDVLKKRIPTGLEYFDAVIGGEGFTPSIFESFPPSMKNMTPELVIWSLPLVFMTAVLTGVLFGIYPARKASEMNPVDALRHQS